MEGITKQRNVELFGVLEDSRESYWNRVQIVLSILRNAMPYMNWTEKDIASVQRLGARNWNNVKPRPILVELTTLLDKITLLSYGRDPLKKNGYRDI